jgi:tripartite-type tricarboxylate transporter receptor subunit TctC
MLMLNKLMRAVLAAVLLLNVTTAFSADWPDKPVRWIVPYPPGGGTDGLARVLGDAVSQSLGQPFVIDNRPGAATIIGAEVTAKSIPDGYTLMSADNATLVNNAAIYPKLPYDAVKDLAPVSLIGRFPLVLVVSPSAGIRDFAQWRAKISASPGKFNYATSGAGTPFHVGMEFIKQRLQLSITHIPYKGMGPAIQDVLAGQVQMMLVDVATALPYIRTDKLIALATAGGRRQTQLPEVPTLLELGLSDSEFYAWQGVVVPSQTPVAVMERMSAALRQAIASEKVAQKIMQLGIEPLGSTPEEMAAYWKSETNRWHKLIRERGIRIE